MAFHCIHCRSEIDPKYKACPFCGEAITDFLRRYLDQPIDGKYRILSRLGVGGMGEVYKVLHVHLNSIRVIKLMRSNIASDPGAHERFLREARMATRIQHPNVAALFDFSTLDDGSRYMVWEYIEGINLHEMIAERGPLSPRYAAKLGAQALHGLDAVHRAGIVHRDVSPENLMITRDDEGEERVKIIDLGIAKQWSNETDNKTKTGMFVGKWKYCSPEHLGMLNEGERIDGRADIYSFGIVMYEMLTGVPPFQADTPHGYLMQHAAERPKALKDTNPGVNAPDLEALIFRAMEKDRTKRFATAREFAQALERLVPALHDSPGAPPPLPAAAESTDEATRGGDRPPIAAAPAPQMPTVVSVGKPAPVNPMAATIKTPGPQPVIKLSPVEQPPPPRRPPNPFMQWTAVVIVLMLAGGGAYMWIEHMTAPPPPPPVPAKALLGINAYPWASVTSIRNVDNDQQVELKGPLVTPERVELAPGRYEVTLSNPAFVQPIKQVVEVRSGQDQTINVPFADASRATLPRFGGSAR